VFLNVSHCGIRIGQEPEFQARLAKIRYCPGGNTFLMALGTARLQHTLSFTPHDRG